MKLAGIFSFSSGGSASSPVSSWRARLLKPALGVALALGAASSMAAGPTTMKIGTVVSVVRSRG